MCDLLPTLHVQLPASLRAPRQVRHLVHACRHRHVDEAISQVAVLLASEIAANAVQHTRSAAIDLTVDCDGRALTVAVGDDDPQPAELVSPGLLTANGRGLRLVDQLSSAWGVRQHPDGKQVWFTTAAGRRPRQPQRADRPPGADRNPGQTQPPRATPPSGSGRRAAKRHNTQVGGWSDAWVWWCACGAGAAEDSYPSQGAALLAARTHIARTRR